MFVRFLSRLCLFGLASSLLTLNIGACGGTIVLNKCEQGILAKTFPGLVVNLPKNVKYTLFTSNKEKAEYGCLGVVWNGQNEPPPSFAIQINANGTYRLQGSDGQFKDADVMARVAPGVSKMDIIIHVLKGQTAESIAKIKCSDLIGGKLDACWSREDCVFAWRIRKDGDSGQCNICQRELCNGVDDNCDDKGAIDEEYLSNNSPVRACGDVLKQACKYVKTADVAKATGCSKDTPCSCLVSDGGKVFLCAGPTSDKVAWVPIENVQSECSTPEHLKEGKRHFCGNLPLLCDSCSGKTVFRNAGDGGSCNKGFVEYTAP